MISTSEEKRWFQEDNTDNMIRLFKKIKPPEKWLFPVTVVTGIFAGLFILAFYVANAPSYLSDNPRTCVNCHVMAPQYATWFHSSHREKAHCNDCHTPNDNFFSHYAFKAKDGLRHATIFTLRAEPQVIMILEAGQKAVQENCMRCHGRLFSDVRLDSRGNNFQKVRQTRQCWECHRETPHGRVHSLASTPFARVPLPGNPVPEWLSKLVDETPKE